jgi:hypothetical protein
MTARMEAINAIKKYARLPLANGSSFNSCPFFFVFSIIHLALDMDNVFAAARFSWDVSSLLTGLFTILFFD